MASLFGHGLVGYTIAKVANSGTGKLLLFLAMGSAILPDMDVLAFNFGIPYLHPLGHRGFTHSIVFSILWGGMLALLFGKQRKTIFFAVISLSTLSHGVLDALTTGGEGVGFLIPFSDERFFFPFKVIRVSPIGIGKFFSEWGLQVIFSELKYIAIPCLLVLLFLHFKRKNNEH